MTKRIRITRRRALAILGVGAALAAGTPIYRMTTPPEPHAVRPASLDDAVTARLQALYDELLDRKDVHQVVVIVETGDGTQRWVGAGRSPGAGPNALVRGQVFDDPATYDLMHEQLNRFGLPLDRAALQLPNWPIEYGLGTMRFQLPPPFNGFQRMPAVVGHTGSTGSWLFYYPELDLFLAGTVNQATAGALPYRFVPKLLRAFS